MIMEIWTENYALHVGDEISTTNAGFFYDEGYNTFSNELKPYYYKLSVEPTRIEHDDPTATAQGGSSGNYSYQYYEVKEILEEKECSPGER